MQTSSAVYDRPIGWRQSSTRTVAPYYFQLTAPYYFQLTELNCVCTWKEIISLLATREFIHITRSKLEYLSFISSFFLVLFVDRSLLTLCFGSTETKPGRNKTLSTTVRIHKHFTICEVIMSNDQNLEILWAIIFRHL